MTVSPTVTFSVLAWVTVTRSAGAVSVVGSLLKINLIQMICGESRALQLAPGHQTALQLAGRDISVESEFTARLGSFLSFYRTIYGQLLDRRHIAGFSDATGSFSILPGASFVLPVAKFA